MKHAIASILIALLPLSTMAQQKGAPTPQPQQKQQDLVTVKAMIVNCSHVENYVLKDVQPEGENVILFVACVSMMGGVVDAVKLMNHVAETNLCIPNSRSLAEWIINWNMFAKSDVKTLSAPAGISMSAFIIKESICESDKKRM